MPTGPEGEGHIINCNHYDFLMFHFLQNFLNVFLLHLSFWFILCNYYVCACAMTLLFSSFHISKCTSFA